MPTIPSTMKVMQIQDTWTPDTIRPATRTTPEPGPGQVLLRMEAASLNYRDYVMANGGYGRRGGALPLVPCSDGAGRVVAVGHGVARVAVGDLVCPTFAQTWWSGPFREAHWAGTLGGPRDGVMQEFMALDQDGVVRAPRHLDQHHAAIGHRDRPLRKAQPARHDAKIRAQCLFRATAPMRERPSRASGARSSRASPSCRRRACCWWTSRRWACRRCSCRTR